MHKAIARQRVERFLNLMVGFNVDWSMLDDDALQEFAAFVVSNRK